MAEIRTFPLVRHLRAEPTNHVLRYRRGELTRHGAGLAFWFRSINSAAAEVPIDDRELPFLFRARSRDFQELTVQGVITFRAVDPLLLARRIDFSVDLDTGRWLQAPLEQVSGLLTQLAQQFVIDELVGLELRQILSGGVAPIRDRIATGLTEEAALTELGVGVVAVRVAAVTPAAEVEKALRQPTREAIQQEADQATYGRRALAVESERAIADNELKNQIELARREEELVEREKANARRRAEEEAGAKMVDARAQAERAEIEAARRAETIDTVEAARLRAEAERARIQAQLAPQTLLALGLRELAGEIGKVDSLTVTPDLITPLIARAAANGTAEGQE